MIKKLRFKFIGLSMMALFVLLAAIIAGMNMINYHAITTESDQTLAILSNNGGRFPEFDMEKNNNPMPKMSPETPYETRYFSVLLNQNGNVIQTDTGKIKAVNAEQAINYALKIYASHRQKGFVGDYRYSSNTEDGTTRITFLDCGRSLASFRNFLFISVGMALIGYFLFFFVILFFSGRIIQPVAQSYEKQKRFITDAGHEIKTPLTIIKADADVLEMELGENEWLTDIQKQSQRLTALTNDLIYLARMEENQEPMPMITFPFSDVVSETASSFQLLAQTQNKAFECHIDPLLSLKGNEKAIRQLVQILLDNALKYSPENGNISLLLTKKKNKALHLSVTNTTTAFIESEKLPMLFERFYRTDASRNSQTGGYGIGLSIAKAIAHLHNAKIHAQTSDGHSLTVTVIFPISNSQK